MNPTGGNFGAEVKKGVGTYGDDGRYAKNKDERGEQQHAPAHARHTNQGTDYETDRDFTSNKHDNLLAKKPGSTLPVSDCAVDSNEAFALQVKNDLLGSFFSGQIGGVNGDFGVLGFFIGIGDPGELFEDAGAGLGVQALPLSLFASFDRGGDVDENKAANRFDHFADGFARGVIRSDRGADRDPTIFGDLRSHVADAANVDVTMFLGKPEFGRKMLAHQVAVEDGDGSASGFEELGKQNVGDGGFSRAGEAGKEN